MVKIKIIDEDVGNVDKEVLDEAGLEDEEAPVGGIFDEDFEAVDEEAPVGGVFDEDFEAVDEEAPVGDFDIGSTMLVTAAPVTSWSDQNLEEKMSRELIKQDWDDAPDAFSGGVYRGSRDAGSDVYDTRSDVYSSGGGRGGGVYNEAGGAYNSGKSGEYNVSGGEVGALKGHEQVQDERHGGRSLLESSFSDRHKRENRAFNTESVAYRAKDAV